METIIELIQTILVLILMLFGIGTDTSEPLVLPEDSQLQVHFIDVGQADAALILCDGEAMLIDGGNVGDSDVLYTYLSDRGVDTLDYVVVTHAHEDHVGGVSGALEYATAETVLCPVTDYESKAFRNFAKHAGTITIPDPGDTYTLGSAEFEIIHCDPDADDPNNTSIVLRLSHGENDFLFTGDAEVPVEEWILDSGYTVDCEVLKVGHHGSSTSTSYHWLYEADPDYAVISVGKDNSYGHPHDEVMSRLSDADVTVFRTDKQGDIVCTSDGETLSFTTSK